MRVPEVPVEIGCEEFQRMETDHFVMTEMQFSDGCCLDEHLHSRHCLSIVTRGVMRKRYGSKEYHLVAPTLVTMPAGERHLDHFGQGGTRTITVEIVPENGRIPDLLEPCRDLLEQVVDHQSERLAVISRQLGRELRRPDEVSHLAANSLVFDLLTSVLRSSSPERMRNPRPPRWLVQAQEYLHAFPKRAVTIEEVAAAVDRHPAYLARAFRKHMGDSIGSYARRLRLESAAGELISTERPILDIALDHGFADQSHFTRMFRRNFGTTPARYRAMFWDR